ncbi:MAG: arsenical pump-driving ATPase [Desulfobacterales bacterium]
MRALLDNATRFLFFTGKGGVGKTSMSCLTAAALAGRGRRVLLISTDPASNLDEVLETPLNGRPTQVREFPGLWAMNIDPEEAAAQYRERIVGPYRGVLPKEAVQSIEEQLSGACTVEIAAFNEFSQIIGNADATAEYDHIILDTAPTGHTLRLLNLPAAWNDFIAENTTGSSCLGPLSGLKEQRRIYAAAAAALADEHNTLLCLVARPEAGALHEAARAGAELAELGMTHQHLIINGVFQTDSLDEVAAGFARKTNAALAAMPSSLAALAQTRVYFTPLGFSGVDAIRNALEDSSTASVCGDPVDLRDTRCSLLQSAGSWRNLLDELAGPGKGLIMTMGKGGVGKTTMAVHIALELACRGHAVHLSSTDPAARIQEMLTEPLANLTVDRIDPALETRAYVDSVLRQKKDQLSEQDLALLQEELRSPCIEEIAVFQAFARTVARARGRFIVLDTAPTGHTLLLLDATEAYHRQIARNGEGIDEAVKTLLPRLRDKDFTKVLLVTLPEATPVHEARRLQQDLRRARIEPFAWIVNQSFALSGTTDPLLAARGRDEVAYIEEVRAISSRPPVICPWLTQEMGGAGVGPVFSTWEPTESS